MIACLVLAAGLGTRLRPLTDDCPKALVPIGDATALAHAVASLRRAGARKIAANAHHHAEMVARECASLDIACSRELHLLGTAGGVTHAREILGDDDILVWNADMFAPRIEQAAAAAAALVNAHCDATSVGANRVANPFPVATLLVREVARGKGNVGWDDSMRITRLRQETVREGEHAAGEFLGIHVVGATLPRLREGCLVGDVYLPALRAGADLRVLCTEIATHDIGSFTEYLAANAAWLRSRGASSFVAPRASVSPDVSVEGSVVGANASVRADTVRCVVWPGVVVDVAVSDAVVYRDGARQFAK